MKGLVTAATFLCLLSFFLTLDSNACNPPVPKCFPSPLHAPTPFTPHHCCPEWGLLCSLQSALAVWRQIAEQRYQLWHLSCATNRPAAADGCGGGGGGNGGGDKSPVTNSPAPSSMCMCTRVHCLIFLEHSMCASMCVYNYSSLDSFRGLSAVSGSCVHSVWQPLAGADCCCT